MKIDPMRSLPHNEAAEQSLLGAVLTDNRLLAQCRDLVDGEDFFVPVHGRIWQAILDHVDRNETADAISLRPFFDQDPSLGEAGAGAYLARLVGATVSLLSCADYANLVRDLSHRRRLIDICDEVATRAYDPIVDEPAGEIATKALAAWNRTAGEAAGRQRKRIGKAAIEFVESLKHDEQSYSTGIIKLDQAMGGGLMPTRVYGFFGRKKTGKTILATTFSVALNHALVPHLFVAAEMGTTQIAQRILAYRMGVNSMAFFDNRSRHDADFVRRAADAAVGENNTALFVDAPGLTFDRLRAYVSSAVAAENIKGVILDYLQLVGGQRKGETQAQHYDNVAQWLANIARELNIWIVAMGQENQDGNVRGGEGMRLAFDQVYRLCREDSDTGSGDGWLEMMETRYTRWTDVGNDDNPSLRFNPNGPMFEAFGYEQRDAELAL